MSLGLVSVFGMVERGRGLFLAAEVKVGFGIGEFPEPILEGFAAEMPVIFYSNFLKEVGDLIPALVTPDNSTFSIFSAF